MECKCGKTIKYSKYAVTRSNWDCDDAVTFESKEEAIDYAKDQAESENENYTIYGMVSIGEVVTKYEFEEVE